MYLVKVERKLSEVVNRLNKTKEEKQPDLMGEREEREREERVERRRREEEVVSLVEGGREGGLRTSRKEFLEK